MAERHARDNGSPGLAALALAIFAVGCCAGLPLLLVVASTVAVGTILGVAAGVVALAALVIGGALWLRRRRAANGRARRSTWRARNDT
jgi:hypothetical protein